MLYIISVVPVYLMTASLCLLTTFTQSPVSPSPASCNHKSGPFFSVFVCFSSIIELQHLSVPITERSDLIFLYTLKRLPQYYATTCYCTKILQFWFLTLYISYVWHLFCNWKLVHFSLPHLFLSSPSCFLSGNCFVLCICNCFCFVIFICFVFEIPYVSEITQHLSFSIWLISINIVQSTFFYVSKHSKFSFYFVAE